MADRAEIQEKIKCQGEIVRKLKSEKAAKEQVRKGIIYQIKQPNVVKFLYIIIPR